MTPSLTLVFWFSSAFCSEFVSIWVKELKYLIIWDSSFWSTSLWGCSLEFLSIIIVIIVSANWRVVFDLKIPSWLFLDTKLNTLFFQFALVKLRKIGFLVIMLVGRAFSADCSGYIFLFTLIFCSCLFVSLLIFKTFVEKNYLFPFERLTSLKLSIFPRYLRLVFSRFLDLRRNFGDVNPIRKTCISREKKRLAPRIY